MIQKPRKLVPRPPLPWRKKEHRISPLLPSFLSLELKQLKLKNPLQRLRPYNSLSYQSEQPPILCPFSAAILHSLKGSRRWGISLMSSLLREMIILPKEKKSSALFKAWDRASLALPILLTWQERSQPLTSSQIRRLRTSSNLLQTDIARILHCPRELELNQLPQLIRSLKNLELGKPSRAFGTEGLIKIFKTQ